MASNKNLDPTSCKTVEEAFKYPLPQVRQFHRTLTSELDEKNARLRTLVGGSYRQLLGTAEMILKMRDDIGIVEDKLEDVGQGCGRGVLEGMVAGLGRLESEARASKPREKMSWVARMKVLNMCGIVIGRLLRREGDRRTNNPDFRAKNLVVAVKVWVLGRSLASSLGTKGEGEMEEQEMVREARRKLASLKKRLMRMIDRTLERVDGGDDRDALAQTLCAHSLATSDGAKDVLMHFLRIRGQAITLCFEDDEESKHEISGIVRALDLYTRTLLDVQALVPRRLSEALSHLKTKPLLRDPAVRELEGLRLDICEKWSGDEILYFTPYIIHDDLEGSQAVETLKRWAKEASQVLLKGLGKTLTGVSDFKAVVELRTRILEVWIREGGKVRGFDPSILLDGLRRVMNDRMIELIKLRGSKLHLVGTEIEATLGSWQGGVTSRHGSLWDDDMLETEIHNGAHLFKQEILARSYGRNDAVSRAIHSYETWQHLIDEICTITADLRKQRWDEDLEDVEDELGLESRNQLLSQDDPKMLQDRLERSLEDAFTHLHKRLSTLLMIHQESHYSGQIAIYLLRIIRGIRSGLPPNPPIRSFGLSLVPSLHTKLVSDVSAGPIEALSESFRRKRVAGRALWEGTPELPVQPSPAIFKFLHSSATSMAEAGADLWSPTALKSFRAHMCSEIGKQWATALEDKLEQQAPQINGTIKIGDSHDDDTEAASGPAEVEERDDEVQRETQIQALFDILTLQCALAGSTEYEENELVKLSKTVESRLDLDSASRKRLMQASKEYWKRTSLLFGTLAL